jgi:branched-chain amino acid transport system substrate-binding protein
VYGRQRGWKRAYLLTDTSIGYSKTGCSYFAYTWKKLGGTVSGESTFVNSDPSIATQVSTIRGAQGSADVLALCSYLPGVTAAVKQLRAGGVTLPILGQLGVDGRVISGAVPDLSNLYYVGLGSVHGGDPNAFNNSLGTKYQQHFGTLNVPDYGPIMGYAVAQSIAAAIQATGGSTDGAKLAQAIAKFSNQDVKTEHLTYSSSCNMPLNPKMDVLQVQKGVVSVGSVVATQDIAPAPC